jgi:uncharacterized protein
MTTTHKRKRMDDDDISSKKLHQMFSDLDKMRKSHIVGDIESLYKLCLNQSFPQFVSNDGIDFYTIAKLYHFGPMKDINYAVMYYQTATLFGNKDAMFDLAICYRDGIGVDCDYKQAFQLFEDAFVLGNKRASYEIARMYQYGEGVERDVVKFIKYYKLADACGCVKAKNNLAVCYQNGDGVNQDINKAFEMFKRGRHFVTPSHMSPCGALKDAFNKINKSDIHNTFTHNAIIYNLARCYEKGLGVDRDIHYAIQLYHEIINTTDNVPLILSHYYENGINADTKKSRDYREYKRP